MSYYGEEGKKPLAGTSQQLRADRQYRGLNDGNKCILGLEKAQGSEFLKALSQNAERIDSFYKYQRADEELRQISRENGRDQEDGSTTTYSEAIPFSLSDQLALEDLANRETYEESK